MSETSPVDVATRDRLLANVFLFVALLPFVSPVPVRGTDAQLFVLACATFALLAGDRGRSADTLLDRRSVLLVAVGWVYLFYVRWDLHTFDALWLRRCGPILLSLPVFVAARRFYRWFDYRTVVAVVAVYLLAGIAQTVAPAATNGLLQLVLGGSRFSFDNSRGITSLTPEPSHLAGVLALCLWMPRLLSAQVMRTVPRWMVVVVAGACVIMIVASGSLLGVVLLGVMAGAEALSLRREGRRRVFLRLAVVVGAVYLGLQLAAVSSSNSRAIAALRSVTVDPLRLLEDPSLHTRIVGAVLAVEGLPDHPLGQGNVETDFEAADRAFSSPFFAATIQNPYIFQWVYDFTFLYGFTEMGRGIQRMGLLYFLVLGFLLWHVRGFAGASALVLWFLAILTQNSLLTATLWLMLGLSVERSVEARHARRSALARDMGWNHGE